MEGIEAGTAPRRHDGVVFHQDGRRSLLVSDEHGTVFELDPIARAIWELSDGRTTIDEMVAAICQVFTVDRQVATADVATLIADLREAGLVDLA